MNINSFPKNKISTVTAQISTCTVQTLFVLIVVVHAGTSATAGATAGSLSGVKLGLHFLDNFLGFHVHNHLSGVHDQGSRIQLRRQVNLSTKNVQQDKKSMDTHASKHLNTIHRWNLMISYIRQTNNKKNARTSPSSSTRLTTSSIVRRLVSSTLLLTLSFSACKPSSSARKKEQRSQTMSG